MALVEVAGPVVGGALGAHVVACSGSRRGRWSVVIEAIVNTLYEWCDVVASMLEPAEFELLHHYYF